MELVSKSAAETVKIAAFLAQEAAETSNDRALVIALEGELGSGKTTFVQGFARALGIKEKVLSPTFALMKIYKAAPRPRNLNKVQVPGRQSRRINTKHLIHIDCYRLDSSRDLLHLRFQSLLKNKGAIILIEWADRVKKFLPKHAIWISFVHGTSTTERVIKLKIKNEKVKTQM